MGRQVRRPVPTGYLTLTPLPLHSAYLLASCALSSFYGKISDLTGRKAVLFPVIVLFLVRSEFLRLLRAMSWAYQRVMRRCRSGLRCVVLRRI